MKKTELNNEIDNALIQQVKEQEKIIEELKNHINQLDTENFQLKNLIDNLPGDIYWKDRDGVWSGVNKRGAQSLQQIGFIHDRSDVIGKSDYQLFSKETADEYRKNDLEVMKLKTEMTHEEINQLPNGEKIIQLSTKRPLWDKEGNIVGVVGNTIDISYLKKIEAELNTAIAKAEAASQAKTEFLENMRHDIRTPLTGIVGFADLLKMESDNPQIKEYSENLVASSHALLNLLDEVLEAIRVGSGEIPKLKKKFSFEQTLRQVIELNRARASEKKLSLTLHIDKSIPKFVIGDKVRLHRVMLELVANALNFTDTGFVTLCATLAKKSEGKLVLKLTVEDSGIGIPKDKQQEIYIQFKRLTPSYQGIYKGAGLGLSVVKQFIDELGGEIYVDSEVRVGTTFICLIPLQEPLLDDTTGINDEMDQSIDIPLETTYAQAIKPTIELKQKGAFRVLVVEDNHIAQTVAKSILAQLHCDADIADTGKRAVELWKNGQYQLILMDIGLPDIDGYEVTHQIRLQELIKKVHCPIIALTAHAGDENKKRCIDAGMNAVLTKPLTAINCADILNAFIPGYNQHMSSKETHSQIDAPQQDESLFNLSNFPLLDIDEGIKATGTEEVLAQMLQFMIHDCLPSDLQLMKKAHDTTDWNKTQQIAHKIKGGAIYVGTTKIKMACQHLETYWKSGQTLLLEPLYQQIISAIDDSVVEINRWLNCH